MIDKNTGFLEITNNFKKTENIKAIPILESKLDFVPKVTIAIPTYKRVDLLKEAIDSAINQKDYLNYDIIVVDNDPERDCETEKLMLTYDDKRISYYKNSQNIGMSGNWNRLFELSRGEYVVMLHDDDLIVSSFLSECMKIIDKKSEVGILKPMMHLFSDSLSEEELRNCDLRAQNKIGSKFRRSLKRVYAIDNYSEFALGAPTGCFFNKKMVMDIGGYNQDFFPSLDYCFAFLFSTHHKTYILKKELVLYRYGVNETLKPSVLSGHITDSYFLRKTILKNAKLPEYFIKNTLNFLTTNTISDCKKLNSNFEFDIDSLNLKDGNKKKTYFVFLIVRVYVKIFKLINYQTI